MRLTGALVTHYHPDHVGGDIDGLHDRGRRASCSQLDGVACRSTCRRDEAHGVQAAHRRRPTPTSSLARQRRRRRRSARIPIELIHTPGHTPGSQCFLVDGRLVAGDTLFLDGCGRTDLPGGDPDALYESLTQRSRRCPTTPCSIPGHLYSPEPSATMGDTRRDNYVFRLAAPCEQWLMMFGPDR